MFQLFKKYLKTQCWNISFKILKLKSIKKYTSIKIYSIQFFKEHKKKMSLPLSG